MLSTDVILDEEMQQQQLLGEGGWKKIIHFNNSWCLFPVFNNEGEMHILHESL